MRQGKASPCLQPLCPRVPQTVIPAKAGISFPIRVQTVFRYPLCWASDAGPATPRLTAQLLENFEEFKNHKLMRKSDSNMHNLHITF